jgi:hypothetical protein
LARRRIRKQRVILRRKRRIELKHHIRVLLIRSAALAMTAGFVLGVISHGDSVISHFMQSHIPEIQVKAPQVLATLPFAESWPSRRYLLWIPGVGVRAESQLKGHFPAIKAVNFQRDFRANRVVVIVEPRTPIVRWGESGMDSEGVIFPIASGAWSQLPKIGITAAVPRPLLGHWFGELAQIPEFWSQVMGIRDDRRGNMIFDLKTGAQVTWGPLDHRVARAKALNLCSILQDAHEHLGGAAAADLRFFDDGRIIVRPKAANHITRG